MKPAAARPASIGVWFSGSAMAVTLALMNRVL
jgi:hypothetical protein